MRLTLERSGGYVSRPGVGRGLAAMCLFLGVVNGTHAVGYISGSFQAGALAAGWDHSLGLKVGGSVTAWGQNTFDQSSAPVPNTNFTAVAGGGQHSLALQNNGAIVAWGRNLEGQLDVPAPNSNFIAVAGGGNHALGLTAGGTVVAWGSNSAGQTNVPSPNSNFIAVAAGWNHSLGLRANGSVAGWGLNGNGQTSVPAPNTNFIAVAGGGFHSIGLKEDRSIVAWGRSAEGQLAVPAPNTNFVAVAAGLYHSVGLKADGTVVAWGDNTLGQCAVPAPNADFVAIAANGYHTLALRVDGVVVAWGKNTEGQTNVPPPNALFGLRAHPINPASGSVTGGYPVSIAGYFLDSGVITNASLAGHPVGTVFSQSASQVVVIAGSAPTPTIGDVVLYSNVDGPIVASNAFRYVGEQTIDFPPIGPQWITNHVSLAATASSGLPVSFSVESGPALITGGTNLTFTGTGAVRIVASQAGAIDWYSAPPITNAFPVSKVLAAVTLHDLTQNYDAMPRVVTATTAPTGLSVVITYDGSLTAPALVGAYSITGVVDDAIFQGVATGTLVVGKGIAEVHLLDLDQAYDGLAKPVTATTLPSGLVVQFTYNGLAAAPTNIGAYAVTGTVDDVFYAGSATGLLVIGKADQSIDFPTIPDQHYTNTLGLAADASSGLPVTFSVAYGPAVIANGTNLSFTGPGLVGITAAQGGNDIYHPAPSVTVTFDVQGAFWLTLTAGPNGSVGPTSGLYAANSIVLLTAAPAPYYHFTNWSGNVSAAEMFTNPLNLLMNSNRTIVAIFEDDRTSSGISIPWLVGHGITNDFEQAALDDPDQDQVSTGDEYIADTHPLDSNSFPRVLSVQLASGPGLLLVAPVSTNRVYDLQQTISLPSGNWQNVVGFTGITPVTPLLLLTNSAPYPVGYLRLRVRLP